MRSYSDEGVVLKRQNFGEGDKIITVFSLRHGKIQLIAKGVRKTSSKRSGSVELFNLLKFHAAQGHGGWDVLTEVQLLDSFASWRKHLGRVNLAYQLVEVVDKLTPDHQPHPEIFKILKTSLSEIDGLKADWKSRIENWLIEIVRELGYWPANREFTGSIYEFMEEISSRPLHSPKLLSKLK